MTDNSRNIYKQARNLVVSKIRESLYAFHGKQMHSLNQDKCKTPKLFWNALKSIYSQKLNAPLPPLQPNGSIITDPVQKAELFNDFFIRQTQLNDRDTVLPDRYESASHIEISEWDTYIVLSNLNVSKSTGPDGIGNRIGSNV